MKIETKYLTGRKNEKAIDKIDLGLENFTSGEFPTARKFIGNVIKLFKPDANHLILLVKVLLWQNH